MNDISPAIVNLALWKPATQSSVSQWSSARTPEEDASITTNGDIVAAQFFHTDHEDAPWWQVDLGEEFIIERLHIFNRREAADRLRRFTVLISSTGEVHSWLPIFCKTDDSIFGAVDDTPFVVRPSTRYSARYVRIRKDDGGFLHLRQCEVLGFKPQSDELQSVRDKMEQIRRQIADEQAAANIKLANGRTGYTAYVDSRAIFVDTKNYSAPLIRALNNGGYEGGERGIVKAALLPTDRVLEVGTAVGVVAMTAAGIVKPANVMTYDANPAMVSDAKRNFAANGMHEINASVGVMRNRSRWSDDDKDIEFFISRDFWASRLFVNPGDSDIIDVVNVPLVCLENKIIEHNANVLICDIEGGEVDLLCDANLEQIRLILMEIHYALVGRQKVDNMIRFLVGSGFNVNCDFSAKNIVLLDRV